MNRRQIAAVLVLRELGIEPKMDFFRDRLVVQKALYLAQAAGCDLGYFYGWYLRGPYCSNVAEDMFAATEGPVDPEDAVQSFALDEESRECLAKIKELIAKRKQADLARCLELLASVHFLVKRKQVPDFAARTVTKRLKLFGKDFDVNQVQAALRELRGAGVLDVA